MFTTRYTYIHSLILVIRRHQIWVLHLMEDNIAACRIRLQRYLALEERAANTWVYFHTYLLWSLFLQSINYVLYQNVLIPYDLSISPDVNLHMSKELEVCTGTNEVKSRAVVKYCAAPPPTSYALLQEQTDLKLPPANWLRENPQLGSAGTTVLGSSSKSKPFSRYSTLFALTGEIMSEA